MRRASLILCVMAALPITESPAVAQCPQRDGVLIARYQLDETDGVIAHDEISGHDGRSSMAPRGIPAGGPSVEAGRLCWTGQMTT
jgi:hypothetical protein